MLHEMFDGNQISFRYHTIGWKTLDSRSIIHGLIFVFKCVNVEVPEFFQNYCTSSNHCYATRRNGIDRVLLKVKTDVAKKDCFYLDVKQSNELPCEVNLESSSLLFKFKLAEIFR